MSDEYREYGHSAVEFKAEAINNVVEEWKVGVEDGCFHSLLVLCRLFSNMLTLRLQAIPSVYSL